MVEVCGELGVGIASLDVRVFVGDMLLSGEKCEEYIYVYFPKDRKFQFIPSKNLEYISRASYEEYIECFRKDSLEANINSMLTLLKNKKEAAIDSPS